MVKKVFSWLGIALLVLIAIILFNTFRTKPWPVKPSDSALRPLPDSAVLHMSQAVQIPTISISDSSSIDTSAFNDFRAFLERSYPLVHQHLSKTMIDQFSYVF